MVGIATSERGWQVPEKFHRKRAVAASIRRIAIGKIDTALAAIRVGGAEERETVHLVRQQLKGLRALIRLVRDHFECYREEDFAFRDLARRLAHTRDADVVGQTYERMIAGASGPVPDAVRRKIVIEPAERRVERRRSLLEGEISSGLIAARRRARRWRFDRKGFPLIADGLRRVYADMRAGEKLAIEQPTPVNFHEWRKQTKYHAAQLAMLKAVAPDVTASYRRIADRLAEALGDHHDIDMLAAAASHLRFDPAARPLFETMGLRRRKLAAKAFRLGNELAAERPADFVRRFRSGWKTWRK